jgi:molybdopterin-guanine dinucleotide biosynthesis protein A
MNRGAIILCGGQSTRMGRDKALLPFGPEETLLQRVVRIVGDVVPQERVICVAAVGQRLPKLPVSVRVVEDEVPNCGPLAGLATGLAALDDEIEAVFVCGCDAPLLEPAFVGRMFELLGDHQGAVVHGIGQLRPLPAIYRANVLPTARELLDRDRRSLQALLAAVDSTQIDSDQLRAADPELNSVRPCNTLAEYEYALAVAFPGMVDR